MIYGLIYLIIGLVLAGLITPSVLAHATKGVNEDRRGAVTIGCLSMIIIASPLWPFVLTVRMIQRLRLMWIRAPGAVLLFAMGAVAFVYGVLLYVRAA